MRRSLLLGLLAVAGFVAGHAHAPQSQAAFHFAVIDEVMTSYGGNASVQFVEIRMLTSGQNLVANSVLGAFDASGSYLGDVLIVPSNVASSGAGVRWIMGTSAFATASGLTPDFTMPASLPTTGGMVCWGAPGVVPPAPGSWDHTNPSNYVDCLAYGTCSGPSNIHIGTPTSLDAIGHSLQRVAETNNNANDFACADPATPKRNNGTTVSMAATTTCGLPPADADGDGVPDSSDNCPNWPNSSQALPPWNVPAGDPDCDGFTDGAESIIGTDPLDPCANTATANDQADDRWPTDFDDNRQVNIVDVLALKPAFSTAVNEQVDIIDGAIDANEDGLITAADDLGGAKSIVLHLASGATDYVDVIDGKIDANEDGATTALDDITNVRLFLVAGGTDQVDVIDGLVDVDESGTVTTADDLANGQLGAFRHNLDGSGATINITDVLALKPFFNKSCTP